MRRPLTTVLLGVAALTVALASCSDSEAGTPRPGDTDAPTSTTSDEPPTTSSSPGDGDLPAYGAPSVDNPIDSSEFEQQPCRMLTDGQVRQAGLVPPGEPDQGAVAPSCTWRNRDSGANVNIQFDNSSRQGLSGAYGANEAGKYDLWLVLPPIKGFPAVVVDIRDLRDTGECPILVGTSDEVTFQLSAKLSDAMVGKTDPCDAAVQVTELALQTMGVD